jgi:formylglycine-generating enzyme required for sulfatase activity
MKPNYKYKEKTEKPIKNISWFEIQEFISRINKTSDAVFRLPTEAEWEYSCRSGGKNEKYSGFNDVKLLSKYANFCDKDCSLPWSDKGQKDGYSEVSPN